MRVDAETVSEYYKQMQIETLPQYNRVAFLHETMYNMVRQAILGEKEDVRKRLDTVQNILVQLMAVVKKDDDDEIAEGLLLLYDYIYVKLESNDVVAMNEALQVLSVLHETFDKLMKKRV
ncbi:MAG: flagellar protein FliS [Chitinivibrionia bacterium]|jgi:flagellin-specific chaperone FliS|nr:flagellar protein FliS [Chitinivibrionia bacterium]